MQILNIPSTCNTPAVSFDPGGTLTIAGRSITTKAWSFYKPLFDWIEEYMKDPAPETILNLDFELLHVDSLVKVMDICKILSRLKKAGLRAEVYWYCEKEDEDMKDMAAMASELLKSIDVKEVIVETGAV